MQRTRQVVWWVGIAVMVAACGSSSTAPPDEEVPPSIPVVDRAPPAISNSGQATFAFHADGATRFTCQLDGGAATPCALPYAVTVADGTHTLTITAYAGATPAAAAASFTWTVDTVPPDTAITAGPPAIDNATTTALVFGGAPAGDAVRYECALDGAPFMACTSPAQLTVAAGAHTFAVRGVDRAGNVDASPATRSWTVDTGSLDTVIVSGPADGAQTQGDVVFVFSTTDTGATFECQIDTQSYAPCTSPAQLSGLAEGAHTFVIRARHGAAIDPTPASRTWMVDLTAPSVQITQAPPAQSNVLTPTFGFSSSDAAATFQCQIDLEAFAACSSPATITVGQGAHTFRVRASDPAGNHRDASYDWAIAIGVPAFHFDTGPANGTGEPLATWAWSTEQNNLSFECQIDGVSDYTPCTSPYSHLVPGGLQTFHLRGTDSYGNAQTLAWSWTVNLPGPTVQITSTIGRFVRSRDVSLAFVTAGDVTVTDCSLDNAAFAPCSSPVTFSALGEAAHTVIVRVRDAIGNASTDARMFTVDVTPPALAITSVTNPSSRQPTVTFSASGFDPNAGVTCTFHDQVFGCRSPYRLEIPYPIGDSDGPQVVTVRTVDEAGNVATASAMFTLDTLGPTVSLDSHPSDGATSSLASFTFSSPDATGFDCQLDNVPVTACTSPFNAFVADGVHTFRVRGGDVAGNFTTRAFTWSTAARPVVETAVGNFDTTADITVSWRNLPGNALDWIAIAPQGSPDATVTRRVYTGGAINGSAVVGPAGSVAVGSYVARAFANDTFTKLADGAVFSVTAPCAALEYLGAVDVHTPGDLVSLAPYTRLGPIKVSLTSSFAVSLPCLEQAATVTVDDAAGVTVPALHLPRLRALTSLDVTNGPPALDLPALTTVSGFIRIDQPVAPDLTALSHVATLGGLLINATSGLAGRDLLPGVTALPAGAIIQVFNVELDGLNNVTQVNGNLNVTAHHLRGLNRLADVRGDFTLFGEIFGLNSLATVGGNLTLGATGPQALTLPALDAVAGELHVTFQDSVLLRFAAPQLRSVNALTVDGSPILLSALAAFDVPLLTTVTSRIMFHVLPRFPYCAYVRLLTQPWPLPLIPGDFSALDTAAVCD